VIISQLHQGQFVSGIFPNLTVEIISVTDYQAGSVTVVARLPSGEIEERIVTDEMTFELVESSTLNFKADPGKFKLAMEAKRMELAGVFDPFVAVSSSNLKPLPHQLSAVYGELLTRVPLRFLLADEPGAGKTIMAGLLIKELILRGFLKRCLIVCPGSLDEQWSGELREKFGLSFKPVTKSDLDQVNNVNPFTESNFLIARMDQLARGNKAIQDRLDETDWDLVIIDEAHRMSARQVGPKQAAVETLRFKLGQRLSKKANHFLLMTATPHTGSDENFHLFLSLLDPEMFSGNFRKGEAKIDAAPVMLRRVKEKLVTFEGEKLFPKRTSVTVSFELSELEQQLYEAVTDYVKEEMARANAFSSQNSRKRGNVSFALTVLQRRLASSPKAILNSLERRLSRLQAINPLDEKVASELSADLLEIAEFEEMDNEFSEGELESVEQSQILDGVTAAVNQDELKQELQTLAKLVVLAKAVVDSKTDTKWVQLRSILESEQMRVGDEGAFEKLIVFTEHRDTLDYLKQRVQETLGADFKVVSIHGGNSREERLRSQTEFTNNPMVPILLATDAAGEGINLQRAHFMVNYDLPWNPNRIEQRFGRIHRIGQAHECTLWNLVASSTREGSVYLRLLEKISAQGDAYNGNLFHVLGGEDLFEGRSLSELLTEAIEKGEAAVEEVLDKGVQQAQAQVNAEAILLPEVASFFDASAIAKQMDDAKARRLAPGFVSGFFMAAFKDMGGTIQKKEGERLKIVNVPNRLLKLALKDKSVGILASQYERITFSPELVELEGAPDAELVAPGSPLMNAVVRQTLNEYEDLLSQGTVFFDSEAEPGSLPRILVCLSQDVVNNFDQSKTIDRLLAFIEVSASGETFIHGTPPFFDFGLPELGEISELSIQAQSVVNVDLLLSTATKEFARKTAQDVLPELTERAIAQLDRIQAEVEKRMDQEVLFWKNESIALAQGTKMNAQYTAEQAKKKSEELASRKNLRLDQIMREKMLLAKPVKVVSVAFIVPGPAKNESPKPGPVIAPKDQEAILRVERRAVDLTLAVEKALGFQAEEKARNNKGYDIETYRPGIGKTFLEVKGRADGAMDFIITESEFAQGHTSGEAFILVLVRVANGDDPTKDDIRYISNPFKGQLPIWGAQAHVLSFQKYWDLGVSPLPDGSPLS
jgi:superfamily II DNA or RNA helicase